MVLYKLQDVGLKTKTQRIMFFKKDLKCLGHIVSKEGVKPLPSKLQAIKKMEPPRNLTELQSFLGLVGYYRRFIPAFANIAQELLELLKKDVSYEWPDGCNQSFKNL